MTLEDARIILAYWGEEWMAYEPTYWDRLALGALHGPDDPIHEMCWLARDTLQRHLPVCSSTSALSDEVDYIIARWAKYAQHLAWRHLPVRKSILWARKIEGTYPFPFPVADLVRLKVMPGDYVGATREKPYELLKLTIEEAQRAQVMFPCRSR